VKLDAHVHTVHSGKPTGKPMDVYRVPKEVA
jgi:hypothetical protein